MVNEVPGRRGRSRSATRDRYLDAANQAVERPIDPVNAIELAGAKVHLSDVAKRAGLTRTGLYRHWSGQREFWRDLSIHLITEHHIEPDPATDPWRDVEKMSDAEPTDDRFLEPLNIYHQRAVTDVMALVRACALGYPDPPDIAEPRAWAEASRLHRLAQSVENAMEELNLVARPPLLASDMATLVWCLTDGLAIDNHFQPGLARVTVQPGPDGTGEWSLTAYLAQCLAHQACVPADTPSSAPREASPTRPRLRDQAHWTDWSDEQRRLLELAADMYLDEATSDRTDDPPTDEVRVPAQVTIGTVAREAGVSRRAVYNIWNTATALRLDLLEDACKMERNLKVNRIQRGLQRAEQLGTDPFTEIVEPWEQPDTAIPRLAYLCQAGHPEVRERAGRHLQETVAQVAELFDRHAPTFGGPLRPGVTTTALATMAVAITSGETRLRRTLPDAIRSGVRGPDAKNHSALALCAAAITRHSVAAEHPAREHRPT